MRTGKFVYRESGKIDTNGKIEIHDIVLNEIYDDHIWILADWDVNWSTFTAGGGKFTKRLGKYIHAQTGKKLSPSARARIGQIVARYKTKTVYYDVTSDLDWDAGDFGDAGSCFWSDRSSARLTMNDDSNFYAVRLYEDSAYELGYGRCWLQQIDESTFVIFNAYSEKNNIHLDDFARIVQDLTGASEARFVTVVNHGVSDGMLWVNGGRGILVGDNISDIDYVDLALNVEPMATCGLCGRAIYDSEEPFYQDPHGDQICGQCFCKYFAICKVCNEVFEIADVIRLENDIPDRKLREDDTICIYCASDLSVAVCYDCDTAFLAVEKNYVGNEYYCDTCLARHTMMCEACGRTFATNERARVALRHVPGCRISDL